MLAEAAKWANLYTRLALWRLGGGATFGPSKTKSTPPILAQRDCLAFRLSVSLPSARQASPLLPSTEPVCWPPTLRELPSGRRPLGASECKIKAREPDAGLSRCSRRRDKCSRQVAALARQLPSKAHTHTHTHKHTSTLSFLTGTAAQRTRAPNCGDLCCVLRSGQFRGPAARVQAGARTKAPTLSTNNKWRPPLYSHCAPMQTDAGQCKPMQWFALASCAGKQMHQVRVLTLATCHSSPLLTPAS